MTDSPARTTRTLTALEKQRKVASHLRQKAADLRLRADEVDHLATQAEVAYRALLTSATGGTNASGA
jgi:hypothetical protein